MSNSVRLGLRARRKYCYVDGTLLKPKPPCTEDDWMTNQSMIVSWLLNTISPDLKQTLTNYENAYQLWTDLEERYSIVDGPRIHQVKTELARCEQPKGMSVGNYYGKLKTLWDDLNKLEPIPTCKCSGCTCNLNAQLEKRRESEQFHQFLMGLSPELFAPIRSQLLTQTP
ncbi:unnamed protein product [Cuscuta epithymum]|uniref:Retrotransposon gag domain-containing protein n=1 Tax=Cuscuta epithymum TaxID=186058 RepID=A0AAV0CFC1_9ASTE|nr:unnamed protein product [Cuscuta epithymum]